MADDKLVRIPCEKCGKKIGVRPDQFGRRLRCPACQTAFRVDSPSTAVAKPAPDPTRWYAPPPPEPDPEPDEEVAADEAGELVTPRRATATARFYQPPGVVFEATTYAVRRAGGEVMSLDRANLHVRFTAGANTNATEHTVYVFPGPTGGSELDIRATSVGGQADDILYRLIAIELAAYLEAHHAHSLATTSVIASDQHPQRKAVILTAFGLSLLLAVGVSIWVFQSRSPSEKSNSSKLNVESFKDFAILARQISTGLTEGISFNDLDTKENKLRDAFAIIDKPDVESPVGQKARKALDAIKSLRATWYEKIYRNGLESALNREITAAGNALNEFLTEYEAIKSR